MQDNIFFNLDYDEFTLEELIENYFEKIINAAVSLKMKSNLESIQRHTQARLIDLLCNLFEGEGFNTKTKKSVLYEKLEKKVRNIFFIIQTTAHENMKLVAIEKTMKEISKEDEERSFQTVGMMSSMLNNAIKCKLIYRYEKLLPKKRSAAFKKNYPILESCFRNYETYKMNEEAKKKYTKIHNNEGISDVVQSLHKCKIGYDYNNVEVKYLNGKGKEINNDKENKNEFNPLEITKQVYELIGPSQAQLIIYIMSLAYEQNEGDNVENYWRADIDVKEYCKLRGIKWRPETAREIYNDIENLSKIIVQYEYTPKKPNKNGKKSKLEKSSLFANRGILTEGINKDGTCDKQVVGVALGKWIETLRVDQFQYINNAFFKYRLRNQGGLVVPISYYINCQHRNNFVKSKNGEFKIKVKNIVEKLNVEERRVKEKGYDATLKKPLENMLNKIKDAEGFEWQYKNGVHNSRKSFEDDIIIFKNGKLDNLYFNKGLTRKEAKKK